MKKKILWGCVSLVLIVVGVIIGYFINTTNNNNNLQKLPTPEVTGGERGKLGIDKNINEETIDNYLNRSDSVYYDVRMLKDDANWESINGDSYLSGFVNGFEVFPYPFIANDSISPELENIVGKGYNGPSLFNNEDGKYVANYKESLEILEYLFPKDKNIFLMCGGGGYAGQTKNLLVSLGWDEDKIYDVGGYWYYNGKNNINVKTSRNEKTVYDFWKVNYHSIDFKSLTKE